MGIIPTSDKFPVLVVLNPHSGRKQGLEAWENTVKPALNAANKPFRLIESNSQGHVVSYFVDNIKPIITDLAQSLSTVTQGAGDDETIVYPTSAKLQIIVLGGDGTVHEIVNGILKGVEGTGFVTDAFRPEVEFSVIPTGTGNAISTSLGVTSVQNAVDRFIAGKTVPLHLMSVATQTSQLYTVVVNSYGLHCATVYDSEEFRHLGNDRFRQAAMKNVENLKQYEGKLSFFGPIQRYNRISASLVDTETDNNIAQADSKSSAVATLTLPGPFTYLLISKQASLEPGFTPTPFAKTSDDWMDVLAVQNVGQAEIMQMFGSTATGTHVNQDHVDYIKAKTIELETPTQGRLCIDGEFLTIEAGPEGKVRFEVNSDPNIQIFHIFA
ncbi:hypothetical protein K457DRAFT_133140 [Linnemannia elongata AG-77]|uniref:DAGKc domain-containing protein n=1 Tax=Linnemannia elongata AG-77 TaxID=1314771 RepID=A0A197KB11_9FUNG|nr:hypothetical protein K457DRAFT_133140 [Linnemannia elongata AG-77]